MGAHVTLDAPKTLIPPGIERWGAKTSNVFDPLIPHADVIMMLRVQNERLNERFFPDVREYSVFYGLNKRRVEMMKDDAVIMHPGPMNRGVEITYDAADSTHSIILIRLKTV
jgi:aspartate carbamoyltransferase catalytic subunit